jgi:hypothetical protein
MSIASENALPFALDIVKLTLLKRPPEETDDQEHQNKRDGNQEVQDFHDEKPVC